MTEEEDKIKQLLKLARISFNFSLMLVITTFVVMMVTFFPEHKNKGIQSEALAEEITPDISVDPSEIKDGIHVPSGLVADTSFELVLSTCTRCHSIEVVKQNRATKQGWKDMIVWMQKTQGLWDLKETEEPILKYLAKNYASVNTGRRKNLENIVWYNLKE